MAPLQGGLRGEALTLAGRPLTTKTHEKNMLTRHPYSFCPQPLGLRADTPKGESYLLYRRTKLVVDTFLRQRIGNAQIKEGGVVRETAPFDSQVITVF